MRRAALILAGGKSSRMGIDKATLPFGSETFLERVDAVCKQVCDEVEVAAGPSDTDEARGLPPGFELVSDPGIGPLAAIASYLRKGTYLFVTACDTPMLQPSLVDLLFRLAEGTRGAVPFVGGFPQATCAVYSGALAAEAMALVDSGERRAAALASLPGVALVPEDDLRFADPDLRSFRGCNTVEEYIELLEFAGQPIPHEFLRAAGVRVARQS